MNTVPIKIALLAILYSFSVIRADAQGITFAFTGHVNFLRDPNSLLDGSITTASGGTQIFGTYTFDARAASNPTLGSDYSVYSSFYSGNGFSFSAGDYNVGSPANNSDLQFLVAKDAPSFGNTDLYAPNQHIFLSPALGLNLDLVELDLQDLTATALTSAALPLTAPDISKYGRRSLYVEFNGNNAAFVTSIDSLTTVATPEPSVTVSVLSLLVTGVGVLYRRRRR